MQKTIRFGKDTTVLGETLNLFQGGTKEENGWLSVGILILRPSESGGQQTSITDAGASSMFGD